MPAWPMPSAPACRQKKRPTPSPMEPPRARPFGSLVGGQSLDRSLEHGLAGAVVGGSVGAVAGAFREKPSSTYRNYVKRCLTDKGFDVIGWN